MSEKALAQRRANIPAAAAAATGPITPEGKAAVSRNGWKHGRASAINRAHFNLGANHITKLFGKPCVTTCPYHPDNPERTEHPCSLVLDGLTHAGGSCLDKTVYVRALDSLMAAMNDGEMDGMHGVLAAELASNLQLLQHIREQITEHGVMTAQYMQDREGKLVLDPETGKPIIADFKANPILAHLIKFSESLGINLTEVLATPRAREKLSDADDGANALQSMLGALIGRTAKRVPRTIDGDDT
jgi:hypothetical protein